MKENTPIYYIPGKVSSAPILGNALYSLLTADAAETVILCIGSPKVSGDRLGPRVGTLLTAVKSEHLHVYGTESFPVHALNLDNILSNIRLNHPNARVLAVDASVASLKHLGQITVGWGPVYPGSGIHKELTGIGDVHITGIVSVLGALDYFILNHVSAQKVNRMAKIIAEGILQATKQAESV